MRTIWAGRPHYPFDGGNPDASLAGISRCCRMHSVLDYCTGGIQLNVTAGTLVIHEGGTTGHLYVLIGTP